MTYRQFIIDSSAMHWVKNNLANGNTLARTINDYCDLNTGMIVSFFPSDMMTVDIKDYSFDFGLSRETSLAILTKLVSEYLAKSKDRLCLFENRLAIRGDRFLNKVRSRILFLDKEVYHILLGGGLSHEQIRTAIVEADTSMALVGVCSSVSNPASVFRFSDISVQEIEAVARGAQLIFVEAFDGGGFLIWNRNA
jgi:hypothetical protein